MRPPEQAFAAGRQCLENMCPTSDPAVQDHIDLVTDRVNNLRKLIERAAGAV
jgi:hypothetical protein